MGKCLVGTNSCDGCGKGGHMVKDFPNVSSQVKGNNQDQSSGPSSESLRRNHFYDLKARVNKKDLPTL